MRREVWRTVVDCARHNPAALRAALRITVLYIHLGPFARHAAAALERKIADADAVPAAWLTVGLRTSWNLPANTTATGIAGLRRKETSAISDMIAEYLDQLRGARRYPSDYPHPQWSEAASRYFS